MKDLDNLYFKLLAYLKIFLNAANKFYKEKILLDHEDNDNERV